jgi:hypothetical protein
MTDSRTFRSWLIELHALRQAFQTTAAATVELDDWRRLLEVATKLCKADAAFACGDLLTQQGGLVAQTTAMEQRGREWLATPAFTLFLARSNEVGYSVRQPNPHLGELDTLIALRCFSRQPCYLVMILSEARREAVQEALVRGQMLADVVSDLVEHISSSVPQVASDATGTAASVSLDSHSNMAPWLDLLADVYRSAHFQSAIFALVNGIAGRHQPVDQVILGWRDGAYMRVRAISHYERFERQTDTVKLFEAALEESTDQDRAVSWSLQSSTEDELAGITLAHRQLQAHLSASAIFTLPLHDVHGSPIGALMLVSYRQDIPKGVLEPIHFLMQIVLPRLEQLAIEDQSWFKRWRDLCMDRLNRFFGRDNLLVKSATVTLGFLLLMSLVLTTVHRVDANGQFVTDQSRVITAPFDGLVARVWASSGDAIVLGQPMAELDTQDLMFQMAELQAERQRHLAEADKARASFNSVDLGIATARAEQVRARIERVRFMLAQARLESPLEGVVVEGERRELTAAPVTKGQTLFRVATTESLYLSLLVGDADIRHIQVGQRGYFALISQPSVRIPMAVTAVVPMATQDAGQGAQFRVLASIEEVPQNWWRPGMTGVAKIEVGSRSWFWVWTHRLIDRLRLALW